MGPAGRAPAGAEPGAFLQVRFLRSSRAERLSAAAAFAEVGRHHFSISAAFIAGDN